jgi:hypothetical protein
MTNSTDKTTVEEMDINLDELLGTPGAENVLIPDKKDEKPTMFSRKENVDLTFLDEPDNTTENESETKAESPESETRNTKKSQAEINQEIDSLATSNEEVEPVSKKTGRHNGLVEVTNKLIEKGLISPFSDNEDIETYTLKDFEELFENNTAAKAAELQKNIANNFYDSLPEELQYAATYVANGGTDLKNIFRSLAAVEEIKSLDVEDEDSQAQIVRSYLHATRFGDSDEIEEEIESWKDRDELEAKAKKFKPKLDAMQEQILARQLEDQEKINKQQQHAAQAYTENIYKTLEAGDINGLKLDKKTQNLLFAGLTQANYPSMSGRPTNLLGHLLEKYQYAQPNHSLIAKALWLLSDEEGFEAKVREIGKKDAVAQTVRALKTEQNNKITSNANDDYNENTSKTKKTGGIPRTSTGFFKR